jgi:hypothetical protein
VLKYEDIEVEWQKVLAKRLEYLGLITPKT